MTKHEKALHRARDYILSYLPAYGSYSTPPHEAREAALKAIDGALADVGAASDEVKCNPHPKAPHGFSRNASHSSGRYVCECEGWDAYDAGFQAGLERGFDRAQEDICGVDESQCATDLPVAKRLTDSDVAYILGQLPMPPTGSGSQLHDWAMAAVREIAAYGTTQGKSSLPTLTHEEYQALERFCETSDDGEGYDVPKSMMRRLAEIGVVNHTSRAIYALTLFGRFVVGESVGGLLEPVEGDQLPAVGSKVLAHLGSSDKWVEHEVTGYYVWGDLGGNTRLSRVFVRLADSHGYPNARMLCDIRPLDFVATQGVNHA